MRRSVHDRAARHVDRLARDVLGAVSHEKRGDLGHVVEFRSSVELSDAPDPMFRVGLGFSHISNAHLGTRNPGVEVLTLRVAFGAT